MRQAAQGGRHPRRVAFAGRVEHADQAEPDRAFGADQLFLARYRSRHDQGWLVEGQDFAERVVAAHRDDTDGLLLREWERKQVMPALRDLYDEIWVYGLEALAEPLAGLECPPDIADKMIYTGYIRRTLPRVDRKPELPFGGEPYVLVTVGGGGDGMAVIDWVLSAYEHDPGIPFNAIAVLGPFMTPARQREFRLRAERTGRVQTLTFDTRIELLMAQAAGIVAMGGYNTFCEILSFDKPAVLVPRIAPRREQLLRATRAAEMGLVRMLDIDSGNDPSVMAAALRGFAEQAPPSAHGGSAMLNGLDSIARLAAGHLPTRRRRVRVAAYG